MNDRIAHSLKVLELSPGASLDEIKRAYRVLVKVWHPDRFPSDMDLQQRALEKTKEINSAYDLLTSDNFTTNQVNTGAGSTNESSVPVVKIDRFTFYGCCFDETTVGDSLCKAQSANRLLTEGFFNIVADWMLKDRGVRCELCKALPPQNGYSRFSHSDFHQRTLMLNASEKTLTVQSLIKPIVILFIRDKLSGIPPHDATIKAFSEILRDFGWDGEGCFLGESYLKAETKLSNLVSDDMIDRLLGQGSAGYWADTKALYRTAYFKGQATPQDWGRVIGFRFKNEPAYSAKR